MEELVISPAIENTLDLFILEFRGLSRLTNIDWQHYP